MPRLRQPLPPGPLAIVGDVHGEIEALDAVLARLDALPGPRRALVFVGDLVDRGPDSVAVVDRVAALVAEGRAHAVVGNHEQNLLAGDRKEGNGWFFGDAEDSAWVESLGREVTFGSRLATEDDRRRVEAFCASLPLVVEREDLRVVHAAWTPGLAGSLPEEGEIAALAARFDADVARRLGERGLVDAARAEREAYASLRERHVEPPAMLPAVQAVSLAKQNDNPIKVLTSGPEEALRAGERVFLGGQWRYVRRSRWWREAPPDRPTVFGHCWRSRGAAPSWGLWEGIGPFVWEERTFCVDYSVGRRYVERAGGGGDGGLDGPALAALLWPEATLCFDDRDELEPTVGAPLGSMG